jgi:HAD superfamily hydrolase (TIGR01509 family)
MIRFILLDVHGVLTTGDERRRFMSKMSKMYGMDREEHNRFWSENLNELDTGSKSPSEHIKEINLRFGKSFSVKEYFGIFLDGIRVNIQLLEMLSKVEGAKVVIVSDTFTPIASNLSKIFGDRFGHYRKFYSNKIGKQKSGGMLESVSRRLNIEPDECVLIDDNMNSVESAVKCGMNGILFKSNTQTLSELRKLGVRL